MGNAMPNDFAQNLIYLRGERDLTQQELGDAVGVSPSQISRYEAGQAMPRKTVLRKLSEALGVSVDELQGRSENQEDYRLYEGFSSRFLDIRARACISKRKLSEMTGIKKEVLAEFEMGTLSPSTGDLQRLAQAFEVDVSELAGTKDQEEVMHLRIQVDDNESDGGVIAITPDAYQVLTERAEELGITTNEIFNSMMERLVEVASLPPNEPHPLRELFDKMKQNK